MLFRASRVVNDISIVDHAIVLYVCYSWVAFSWSEPSILLKVTKGYQMDYPLLGFGKVVSLGVFLFRLLG